MGIVREQSVKNSISFYIGMAVGAINTVIIYPNVFKDNPEYFGLIQILLAYAIVISTFTTFGIPKIFLRFFPAIKDKGQLYFLSLITPIIGFLLATLIYILFKEEIFYFLNATVLLKNNFFYIIFLIFFIGFYEVLTSISRSFLHSAIPVFLNEVFLKIYSMSTLLLHWFGFLDFATFLKIYFLGYFLKFAVIFIIQFFNNQFSLSFTLKDLQLKRMLSYGLYVLIGGAAMIIVTRLDLMMIGSLLDLQQVAFYTVAFFIGNAIMVPGKSIVAISTPLIAKAWENQDFSEIQNLYSKSSINQLIIGGIFFLCVWINIDEVFDLLPEKFRAGKWVVFYIGLSQLFNISTGVNGAIIMNSKYFRYDLYTSLILVFLTIITNFFLIQKYGINGAAMATALSVFLFHFTRVILLKIKMNMQPFSYKTIYTIILLILIYFLLIFLPNTGYALFDIFWKSLIALLIFGLLVLYFNLSDDISLMMKDFKNRFF
tara:strand:+ start:4963 stop:6420 length:1458 start_codon:yes stop_codon:yes gene_type:complete